MLKKLLSGLSVTTMALLTTACTPASSTLCTMNYVSIHAMVRTTDNSPVAFDSYRVISQNDGSNIGVFADFSSTEYSRMQKDGNYLIINDSQTTQLTGKKLNAKFIGYIKGKAVFDQEVVIGANSCHVFSEPRELTFIYNPTSRTPK